MSLKLEEKKAVVAEVSKQIENAQTMILAEYRGVGVQEMTNLRTEARKSGVYLKVLKNNFMWILFDGGKSSTVFLDVNVT